jgi:hypothetical protein
MVTADEELNIFLTVAKFMISIKGFSAILSNPGAWPSFTWSSPVWQGEGQP